MIKVGISAAGSPVAGEIIRILINHPEVDIVTLFDPDLRGRSVSSVHHGLIGESIVNFADKINPEELDVLFLTQRDGFYSRFLENSQEWENLNIIDVTNNNEKAFDNEAVSVGLSEINRKNIVRTLKDAFVPSALLVSPLIAFLPLAKFMLLNDNLDISVSVPEEMLDETENPELLKESLKKAVKISQPSFSSDICFKVFPNSREQRVIAFNTVINCSLSLDEIEKIYDGIYDDHNFTFITNSPVSFKEVEGTQKCVICLSKPSPASLEITSFTDGRLRGGAGDAVHVMNLLKGLYEKTGLQLKASSFRSPSAYNTSNWFA